MKITSLLDGVTPADILLDPYPHVFVPDVLAPDLAQALGETFPPFSSIGWADDVPPPSNSRFQLSAAVMDGFDSVADVWKEFTALHSSPAFYQQVVALFRDHWAEDLKQSLGGELLGHSMGRIMRNTFDECRILQDARIEINTPVTKQPSSSRGAHLDTPNRMFTCLYYLRHPDDDAVGGDLELFRWKTAPPASFSSYDLPLDMVEMVKVIPYRANQMVIFPQGINAIHGVGIRHPTPHTRRYVFISAEIGEDWLKSPTVAEAA